MKKRITATILALMLLATVNAFCFADASGFVISAQSETTQASKGDEFSVSFYANDILYADGIVSLTAHIEFDHSQLDYKGISYHYPKSWTKYFATAPQVQSGNKTVVESMIFCDVDQNLEDFGVADDDTLGFTLKFSVKTASVVTTTIKAIENDELICTVILNGEPTTGYGKGASHTVSLNNTVTEESSEEESFDPHYSAPEDQSYEEVSYPEEDTSVVSSESGTSSDDISAGMSGEIISDVVASQEVTESSTGEDPSAEESSESSVVAESSSDSSTDNDESGTFTWIFIIIGIVVAIVAAIAVIVYIKKNKTDDMNPVNPG